MPQFPAKALNTLKNEQGQTILMVVLVMIIALSVGIAISTRFIGGIRLSGQSDSSYRAAAVAEAAIERLLIVDDTTLQNYVDFGTCGSACTLTITGDDGVVATANVSLSYVGNTSEPMDVPIQTTSVAEINMDGYGNEDASICWDDPSSGEAPAIVAHFIYGTSGSYDMDSYAVNADSSSRIENGFDFASANHGFQNCFTISGQDDPQVLRLRSVYNDVTAFFVPEGSATIPSQGILIESVGTVLDSIRKVTVVKSSPTLPVDFDFVLYSKSTVDPLTNAGEDD